MTSHENTPFHHLAVYFGQSDIGLMVWIFVIAIVILAGVGYGVVQITGGSMPEEK